MATEYKLHYTAIEIDEKLGKIDNLATKSEVPTKTSDLTNDSGFIDDYTETDPTVPAWAKESTKPKYTKSEIGLGNVDNVKQYSVDNPPPYPVTSINGKSGAVTLTANDVGAEPLGTITSAVSVHNTDITAHEDIREQMNNLFTEIAGKEQLKPEFANSIEECIDTTKLYVLPDGYIYGYVMREVLDGGCTNLAQPLPDNTTDTEKWVNGYRISSSGISAEKEVYPTTISNTFECKNGDVIRIKGVELRVEDRLLVNRTVDNVVGKTMEYYNASPALYGTTVWTYDGLTDGVHQWTLGGSDRIIISSMRISFAKITDPVAANEVVITKNQEIIEPIFAETYDWASTGLLFVPADYEDRIVALEEQTKEQGADIAENAENIASVSDRVTVLESGAANELPDYWLEHLEEKIATIKNLQATYGRECFSFVFMTDTHYTSNLAHRSPLLAKKIMDECNIRYAVHGGDAQTRGLHSTKEELLEENKNIEAMFAPIRDRLLFVEGNHDGAYGTVNGVTYAKQLTDAEMHEEYFRRVGFVGDVYFCDEANAYYVDDVANKVRYICLDTHCVPDAVNEDGTAVYNKFRSLNFTQAQFDFLTSEALVNGLTDKWSVVVIGHIYIHERQNDCGMMVDLLSAYKNKTTYQGSYTGNNDFDSVSVNIDFTTAKGTLVGYFCGHKHVDAVYQASGVNVIITRCDAKEENDATLKAQREKGKVSEQSFDVFTITPDKIIATKIGAGSDREISY